MAKPYNPLNHSVVQACVGAWEQFEVPDYVDALFDAILKEIKRVHWNVYQHSWEPTWHGDHVEDPELDGIAFVRYYQDRCDCGGMEPKHSDDCDYLARHSEWNQRRLKAITDDDGNCHLFDEARNASFVAANPLPDDPCGANDAWDENQGCLPTCIGKRPNFQFEDVAINWYKYPGRGMSTNKDWTPAEWVIWFDRCLAHVRSLDSPDASDSKPKMTRSRLAELRSDFNRRHKLP